MGLPDFLIIGVARGGTSTLFRSLARHPYTRIARGNQHQAKEVRFFGGANWKRGINWYRSLFPENSHKYKIFEATPDYYYDPCQGAIQQYIPGVKAIMLLRNPTDRAWSIYWLYYRQEKMFGQLTYEQFMQSCCRPVQMGVYVDCIKRWHSFFPKENLFILRSEDLFASTPDIVNKCLDFLGLSRGYPLGYEKFDPLRHRKRTFGFPPPPLNPDFGMACSPTELRTRPGETVTFSVSVLPIDEFTGTIRLEASGVPTGASVIFSRNSIRQDEQATMTIQLGASVSAGTYPITVRGVEQ